MAKSTKPRACDLAFALDEYAIKHRLDTSKPADIEKLCAGLLVDDPAFAQRLLRIQHKLPSSITARWRAAKGKNVVTVAIMDWLAVRSYKTESEQHAAFDALQYMTEIG